MKFLVVLCALALVALSAGKPQTRGKRCIYIEGRCWRECEEGTHSYTIGCGPMTPEPTCDEPNPVASRGAICDYSACYCNSPTIRDSVSRKCVQPEECPKKDTDTPKKEKDTPEKEKDTTKDEKDTPKKE